MRVMWKIAMAAVSLFVHSKGITQEKEIHVVQIAALSGPAATIGLPVTQAAHAFFRRVNQEGGINGHKVILHDRDDAFKPERTLEEARRVLKEQRPIALLNVIGAPNNGQLVTEGLLAQENLAVVGAFTGATSVRALKSPHLFFIRASVESEAKQMLKQLNSLGVRNVALVHANDGFGLDAKSHVTRLASDLGASLVATGSYEPATADVSSAVHSVRLAATQAVLFFGTGAAASKFVLEYRKAGGGAMIIANSSTSPEVLTKLAGEHHARGVGLVQVVPPLTKLTIPAVKDYMDTLKKYGDASWTPSAYGLEGFLAAKVLTEALRRAGPNPDRASLMRSLDRLGKFDAGGLVLDYSSGSREGLRYVEIGIIGAAGRILN